MSKIKSPFPFFGGKSKVADLIWSRLGHVSNYIEPFAGSLAVLLANPHPAKIETINDKNHFIANFWRAITIDPAGVAKFADHPVNEADLHARHHWLVSDATDDFKYQMDHNPDFYDLKIAGWWVWGISASIGSSWMNPYGVNSLPLLSSAGSGIHGLTHNIFDWFTALQTRLRRVRVACGDWERVMSPSITFKNKGLSHNDVTAIFLDPPYLTSGRDKVYLEESNIFPQVYQWALDHGDLPNVRIALCGYDSELTFPDTWETVAWKTNGGFANASNTRGRANSDKERIWFSPHCLKI
jgi:DNA adenine methylase